MVSAAMMHESWSRDQGKTAATSRFAPQSDLNQKPAMLTLTVSQRLIDTQPGDDEMRLVFSDETRVGYFLRIEVALAKVEAAVGIIPVRAYEEIAQRAPGLKVNWERLRREEVAVGHPVAPFLSQLAEACGSASEYLHWGSSTRDVNDIAFLMQMHEGVKILQREARQVHAALLRLTEAQRDSGTTKMLPADEMHASPMSVGFRCAMWLTELERQIDRVARMRATLVAGQFAGSVATLAALGDRGLEVQQALMLELGLQPPAISWFASRDRLMDVTFTLATLAGCMAGIARTILAMTRDDAPGPEHASGCESVILQARMVSRNSASVMEALVQEQTADMQGHFEACVVPQSFQLAHAAVSQLAVLLVGLEAVPPGKRAGAGTTQGMVMADSVTVRLGLKCGRRTAHRLVSRACDVAQREKLTLREALLRDGEIKSRLSMAEIDDALDPANYLECGAQIVDQVIASAIARRA